MPRSRSRSPLPALGGAYAPARRRRGNRLPSRYALFLFLLWLPCVVKVKRPKACATRSLPYFPTCTRLFRSAVFFSLLSPASNAALAPEIDTPLTLPVLQQRVAIQRTDLSCLAIQNSIPRAASRTILIIVLAMSRLQVSSSCRVCKCHYLVAFVVQRRSICS